MSIPMSHMKLGQRGQVLDLTACGAMRHRLLDLGLVPGADIERVMDSAGGDPVCYRVRGAMIALRNQDAGRIRVAVDG